MITKKIAQAIKKQEVRQVEDICLICGGNETNDREFQKKNKVLSANFNDITFLKSKDSDVICGFCQDCLDGKLLISRNGKPCGLRAFSFLVENGEYNQVLNRDKENYLFEYQFNGEFILCFSDSGQKHISFKAVESTDTNNFWVCTESGNYYFQRQKRKPIWKRMKELFLKKCPKKILLGDFDPRYFKKLEMTFEDMKIIKENKDNVIYKLIIGALQGEKKDISASEVMNAEIEEGNL